MAIVIKEERAISAIEEVEAPRVVEITTSDNVTFYVAADQKLFVTHKWVEAQQLTLEDVLMTKDHTFVKVVGIRHLEKPMTLRFIAVDEHHNFFAAENGVLIHNGPVSAAIGGGAVRVVGYGVVVGTTIAAFLGCAAGGGPAVVGASIATGIGEMAGISGAGGMLLAGTAAAGETGAAIAGGATAAAAVNAIATGATATAIQVGTAIETSANWVSGVLLVCPLP